VSNVRSSNTIVKRRGVVWERVKSWVREQTVGGDARKAGGKEDVLELGRRRVCGRDRVGGDPAAVCVKIVGVRIWISGHEEDGEVGGKGKDASGSRDATRFGGERASQQRGSTPRPLHSCRRVRRPRRSPWFAPAATRVRGDPNDALCSLRSSTSSRCCSSSSS
jgi:hypothetical protein